MTKKRGKSASVQRTTSIVASPVDKLLAFLIDTLILAVTINIGLAFFSPFQGLPREAEALQEIILANPTLQYYFLALFACIGVICILYMVLFQYRLKSTPGMRILRLEIDGAKGIGPLVLRNLGWIAVAYPSIVLILLAGIDILSQFADKSKRRLLEQASKTSIVKRVVVT